MSVASRGKTYSDKPGWALDPKTKLELKRRKELRELPGKFGGRDIVTSENREEFMAKKLKLDQKPAEDEQEMKFVVKYMDENGKPTGSEKTFDSEEKAVQHAKKGNLIDKVGGKYIVSKVRG